MSILKTKPEMDASLLSEIAVELCKFANGSCECRDRGRLLCDRTEYAASKIIGIVSKQNKAAADAAPPHPP